MTKPFTATTKLGAVAPPDTKPESPFNLPRRLPGWHSDSTVRTTDLALQEHVSLYPEEALAQSSRGVFLPPPCPEFEGVPFAEPSEKSHPEEWLTYLRKWVVGSPIVETDNKEFYHLLLELAQLARNYNADLYRLRRLHYYHLAANGSATGPLPPRNPHGELDDPEPKDAVKFAEQVRVAETNWKRSTATLDAYLAGTHRGLKVRTAEMIEINQYIVSMRIILAPRLAALGVTNSDGGDQTGHAGTSSSLVSVSSNKSSSSSSNTPPP